MCSALKILVCVASVLALTVATNERRKRDYYDLLSSNPWQSPTSYGFRPTSNYYNLPSTKISRVNNYNPYGDGRNLQGNQIRNSGQSSDLYSVREQNSDWIPINTNSNQQYNDGRYGQGRNTNSNQQYNDGRYGQSRLQKQRINAYNTIRSNPSLNVEEQILNGRTGQRQPNYSVQIRGGQINPQVLRAINAKLAQSNQVPEQTQVYRTINQGSRPRGYPRQSANLNREVFNPIYTTRASPLPLAIEGQFLGKNYQGENQRYPVPQSNQPIDVINQQALKNLISSNELPIVEGRILGLNVQREESLEQKANDLINQQNLRAINDGQILGANNQKSPGYAVEEITEPEDVLNQQGLRGINNEQSNQVYAQKLQEERLAAQVAPEQNVQLRIVNPENVIRSEESQEARLRNYIQQNNPSVYYGQRIRPRGNEESYRHTLALINSNQEYRPNQPIVQENVIGNIVRPQLIQSRPQILKAITPNEGLNNNIRFSQQLPRSYNSYPLLRSNQASNDEWRQERLPAQLDNLRSAGESNGNQLEADSYLPQQANNQNGENQRPNVYSYAELTAKIWKVIKSNPEMMSNLDNLRDQLLNERNSRNDQIRELRGLLEEARKYRNSGVNSGVQTLEQQERNEFLGDLIDTMNKNEETSNSPDLRRQLTYLGNNGQRENRYTVRPSDVNPLIKNILFATARNNGTQTSNAPSVKPAGIIVRPSSNIPLPQLEVAEPYGLEQLDHHYDLTQWKQITESLKGNPFLQQYNILEHLV
ncbi:uncharacterized protein LOC123309954 [Coccinella septempunctata]|uniref:uncharacterized protein LOC123309954 n=1 Tax=Coccinella septempunctata TaxID=41139 RepID=UPI001D08B276|nr:uncharacterized protein LOC123309954 [Coccinella septempunctata]